VALEVVLAERAEHRQQHLMRLQLVVLEEGITRLVALVHKELEVLDVLI
jgi:hypothetical protein